MATATDLSPTWNSTSEGIERPSLVRLPSAIARPMSRLPSLNAVRTFAVAARLESFTAAAQELHVTQGAVSRLIQTLQEDLGVQLFTRSGRSMQLTAEGEAYFEEVRKALDGILAASNRLRQARDGQKLSIVVNQGFAARWLVPRLASFQRQHPQISLDVMAGEADESPFGSQAHIAIRYGTPPWPGVVATRLTVDTQLEVLAAPSLLASHPIERPEDLARVPLLAYSGSSENASRDLWREYFGHYGIELPDMSRMPRFYQLALLAEAAACGLGFIVGPRVLYEKELKDGRLAVALPHPLVTRRGYYITHTKDAAVDLRVVSFKRWLLSPAQRRPQA